MLELGLKIGSEIVLLFTWIVYAILEGWREAKYFHKITDTSKIEGKMLHRKWNYQRALVMLAIFVAWSSWSVFGLGLMFPFFHDGMYYKTRNSLNASIYPKKWFDQSTTSTALLSKFETPIIRVLLFVVGVLTYVSAMIFC